MLDRSSPPSEETSTPFQVEANQPALSQDVAAGRGNRWLWTGSGFAVLALIGVSACALFPVAPHASGESSGLDPSAAFSPALPALRPGGIGVGRHPGGARARQTGFSPAVFPRMKRRQPAFVPRMSDVTPEDSVIANSPDQSQGTSDETASNEAFAIDPANSEASTGNPSNLPTKAGGPTYWKGQNKGAGIRLLVIGGNGYVGRQVVKYAVQEGYTVTSLSRRGQNPFPDDPIYQNVEWAAGNALDEATISKYVEGADAVVHAIGLLFDVNSGLVDLNKFTSASKSVPNEESTYDNITRKTAMQLIAAMEKKYATLPADGAKIPIAFVSCAEAGWPDVTFGKQVDEAAPDWLKRYLAAKRAVEAELGSSAAKNLRPIILRPSLIWDWKKFDVLPAIPIFNLASAIGVPFIDKTVRVETIGKAIVAGLLDAGVSGVKRVGDMESLADALDAETPADLDAMISSADVVFFDLAT